MVDPLRIRSVWLKLAYVGVYVVLVTALRQILSILSLAELVQLLLFNGLAITAIVVGARIFRARGEEPLAPRPWWQLTGRPKAGIVIGTLLLVSDAITWINGLVDPSRMDNLSAWILSSVFTVVISLAYFHSSTKLRRHARATR